MKIDKVFLFILLLSFITIPVKGQTVFSTEFEPDFVSYEKIDKRKYQPSFRLSLKTESYFTSASLNFRKRKSNQNEKTDAYYKLNGGSEFGNFGFRGMVLRADNEGVSNFTLLQIETFKKPSTDFNLYPLYEYRYYDGYNRSLNNIGVVFTKRTGFIFTKTTVTYEFETKSLTPTISHNFQITSQHNLKITAASDNYYYALNPFGPADFYSPFDEKYIIGSWNTKVGDGGFELGLEGGYVDQPLIGDTYIFGLNIHFNMISQ